MAGGENVGGIFYSISLDTAEMIRGQREVESRLQSTAGKVGDFGRAAAAALTPVAAAIGTLVTALKLAELAIAAVADSQRMLAARVNVAAGSVDDGSAAMKALYAISRKTETSVDANVDVFTRLNQSMLQLGGTQDDTLKLTELLGKAIKVSGAGAQEASAAMLQFGQALGSGKLGGDELRSLLETAPYLMRQLADGMGVPVGALRTLGEQGKLTADVVVAALGKAADKIGADFEQMPPTFEAAGKSALDAAKQVALGIDNMTGSSSALTGIARGVGTALDYMAGQLLGVGGAADETARKQAIQEWANKTTSVLSYVADAADFVSRMFRQMGAAIGGTAAAVGAAANGEFRQAAAILGEMKADIDAIGNAPFAGAKFREKLVEGAAGVQAPETPSTFSKLKPQAGGDGKKKGGKTGEPFDVAGYLAGLKKQTVDAMEQISIVEQEARRKADELLAKGKINREHHAEAVTLIEQAAEQDRQDIREKAAKKTQDLLERTREMQKKIDEEYVAEQKRIAEYVATLTKSVNPIAALRDEYEAKLGLVREYELLMAQAGIDASAQAANAKKQIDFEYEKQRQGLAEQAFRNTSEGNAFLIDSLNAMSQTASQALTGLLQGTITAADAMRALGQTVLNEAVSALVQIGVQQIKNALIADTVAAADAARKAASGAAYTASVAAQVAGMTALAAQNAFAATAAIPIIGPGLAPAAAAAAGAAAAALGSPAIGTAPIAGARQYGGPVDAGSMYRINETGRPEMFTAANGAQYMLPTKSGKVTPANDVGGGGMQWNIVVNNSAPGATATASVDESSRTVTIAVAEVSRQIASNTGPVWSAMRNATNVQGRVA